MTAPRRPSMLSSVAPMITGSATSSGVSAPCSCTAHGVSSISAGVRAVATGLAVTR